jgi:hypothetical protein
LGSLPGGSAQLGPFCRTTNQLVPESMGKMSKKAKIARFAGCEHNRDAVMAGP